METSEKSISHGKPYTMHFFAFVHCKARWSFCNELGGNMARFTQFPIMITRSTIIYEIISPGAAGSSIYV